MALITLKIISYREGEIRNKKRESRMTLDQCVNKKVIGNKHCEAKAKEYIGSLMDLPMLLQAVLTLGTVGNILCIITLLNNRFRKTSTGFILLQMALLDIGQMITIFIQIWGWQVCIRLVLYQRASGFLLSAASYTPAVRSDALPADSGSGPILCIFQCITGSSVAYVEWCLPISLLQQFSCCSVYTSS